MITGIRYIRLLSLFLLILRLPIVKCKEIFVPQEYPTINQAIEAAQPDDEIIVSPGLYEEDINGTNRATIRSVMGPTHTTISGIIYIPYSPSRFEGFTISGYAENKEGIITQLGSSLRLVNCHIIVSEALVPPGEPWRCLAAADLADVELLRCILVNETYCIVGGAAYFTMCSRVKIENCVFLDNTASVRGGAICATDNSDLVIKNCVFFNNTSPRGGAIYSDYYDQNIRNCIFLGNSATNSNGAVIEGGIQPYLPLVEYNCFWQNDGALVSECTWGFGNILSDPIFVDPEQHDYHLGDCSPCIDSGDPEDSFEYEPDPHGGRINMGNYGNHSEATSWSINCPTRTPTPTPCQSTGVSLMMPDHVFSAGDMCWCTVTVCNASGIKLESTPLFVILDVYGSYFFGPEFTNSPGSWIDLHPDFAPGETIIEVIPEFTWPDNTGSADGIFWYAALTDLDVTEIIGDWDSWEFSW